MGFLPNLRKSNQESAASASSSSTNFNNDPKKKWINLMPLCVALVVIAEIAFLGRLDVASWTQSLDFSFISGDAFDREADLGLVDLSIGGGDQIQVGRESSEASYCEEWLERADAVVYSRDFKRRPVFIAGGEQEWKSCSVGCKFGFDSDKTPDAAFGLHKGGGVASVIRSMESAQYYAENKIANARRWLMVGGFQSKKVSC